MKKFLATFALLSMAVVAQDDPPPTYDPGGQHQPVPICVWVYGGEYCFWM